MLRIEQPKIINVDENHSRLSCDIYIDNDLHNVWFEVEKEYEQYLCTERSDAFVIGLLSWAMRLNHNIECVAPVTDELLYNIRTYVIPSLTKYGKTLHDIKIKANMAPALETAGGVGTGCSCGVDSFHSILSNYNSEYPNCKLTHLCLNNVGSFGLKDNENIESTLINTRRNVAREIADKLGLKVVVTNSNFADAFIQDHLMTHTYSSSFAIYCLQKLWKTYFYSSAGIDFTYFQLPDNDKYDSAHTELLLLNSFSHENLRLYSEGGAKTRLEKTEFIANNELAQEYLHVCLQKIHNCGKCPKCVRTMNSLYALGKLDNFSKVFNVDYYKKHKDFYLKHLYWLHLKKNTMTAPEYEILKKEISILKKLKFLIIGGYKLIIKYLRKFLNSIHRENITKEFK